MKLKIKNFKWLAGRPVVILHDETAKKMNVFVNDKVSIKNIKTIYAVVDIFSKIKDKINGERLKDKELEYLISEIVQNNLTEAEIAYFITAQKISGMSIKETIGLTKAMIKTGTILNFRGKYIAAK